MGELTGDTTSFQINEKKQKLNICVLNDQFFFSSSFLSVNTKEQVLIKREKTKIACITEVIQIYQD
jgi:hypothetical protein